MPITVFAIPNMMLLTTSLDSQSTKSQISSCSAIPLRSYLEKQDLGICITAEFSTTSTLLANCRMLRRQKRPMGWWDSLWPSSTSAQDPLRNLDPKLRKFLENESPVKYSTTQTPSDPTTPIETTNEDTNNSNSNDSKTPVPAESQFQDGRYAHLWKSYRPLAEIEAETKTDHEKLMDVLDAYKERKAQIGRAALENCALEQVDWRWCMTNPSFSDRMTMCREQVRKFERCYMTQTRLLKALGYLSSIDRSSQVEEDIQMHADALYNRMLKQEAEIEEAKKEGRPIPKFDPVIPKPMISTSMPEPVLTPEQQETLRAKLENVAEDQRAAEEEAIKGEIRAKSEVASRVQSLWQQQEAERRMRKEKGEETLWDKFAGTFGNSSNNSNSSSNSNSNSNSNNDQEKK
ncbi:hypothetical protein GGS21DRAFT_487501 [Xylaria nigripes]|nr:hypothetical protein GGS21DRAFT_487501 [Xylaria nigripes]